MKKGFTLIELMVVIGIVTLLTAGSIYALSSGRDRRQAKTTAEKIKSIIEQAVSQARTPDDSMFGVQKIEIDVYPYNSSIAGMQNQIRFYTVNSSGSKGEISKLSFKALNGLKIDVVGSNMKPSGIRYSYFSINTSGNSIGQLTDIANPNNDVFLKVSDTSGNENYQIRVFRQSGLVAISKI